MRVVIFEDEQIASQKLRHILLSLEQEIEVVAILPSLEEGRAFLAANKDIDLGFFDIHLEDGLSFKLLEENSVNFPVIFTTAYDRYAIEAFKHNSIDYLLKPIQKIEVERALTKYSKLNTGNTANFSAINDLYQSVSADYKERFTVKYGDRIRLIPIEEIQCFYSRAKGSFIFNSLGKSYLLEDSLENITILIDPKIYFKVNRKHIVRLDAIDSVIQYSNSRQKIILKHQLDEEIIVAREKVKAFKTWLEG